MSSSKNYKLFVTNLFLKEARQLKNKYPNIKKSFRALGQDLKSDPISRSEAYLGHGCYKVRMEIGGKSTGKSYGARVIIYVRIIDKVVYLLSVYDKSDKKDLDMPLELLLAQRDHPVKRKK